MFVMQITRDEELSQPESTFTPGCELWQKLLDLTDDNVEHDKECQLATEEAYYVWSTNRATLMHIAHGADTEKFWVVITDDPLDGIPLEIPEWSEVLPV